MVVPSTQVIPPTITGDAFVGGILYVDEGLDDPTTTYTLQWVSGATVTPTTPISGQTGLSYTAGAIAGDYVRCAVTPANGQPVRYTNVVRIHAATMTAPVLSRTSSSGGSPFTYTVTYDNTVFADDIERVQYASDIDFTTILWDATRGLTEAAFVSPFLSDDSADADPAWSTAPPTFTGTYFVRRKVIALELFGGLQVESNWSEPISNFNIDPTVKFNPSASFTTSIFSDNNYTFSGGDLTFTAGSSSRAHVAVVNYTKSGKRTAEIVVDTLPTNAWAGIGFDDGTFNWAGPPGNDGNLNQITGNGWKGAWGGWIGYAWNHYKADGTTTTGGSDVGGNALAVADRIRATFTPGTFTGLTPNNDGTLVISRIRSGTEVTIMTITGISSFAANSKLIISSNLSAAGTLTATAIPSPAIPGDSQEYQA